MSLLEASPTQIRLLYRSLPLSVIASLLVIAALVSVLNGEIEAHRLYSWAILATVLVLLRGGIAAIFHLRKPEDGDLARWMKLFFVTSLGITTIFGAAPIIVFPENDTVLQLLLFIIIFGVAAGGATTLAPHFPTAMIFIVLLLGPLTARFFFTYVFPAVYGALTIVFSCLLILTARNVERFLKQAVALQEENAAVIKRQREVEAALRQSEADFRQLAEGSIQGILIVHCNHKPAFANDECARIFGFDSHADILALRRIDPLIAPHEVEHLEEVRQSLFLQRGKTIRFEFDGLKQDGSVVALECLAGTVDWRGQIAAYVTLLDVTGRRRIEEQLHQSQKMEAIGQLTGGVAHDFNNLLAVISGNAELLAAETGNNSSYTKPILQATERGSELTQRLLAFSRRQPLQPVAFNAADLVGEMSDLLDRALGETITIETRADPDLWQARADPGQVQNALLNLAINARDAMPDGGTLTIECVNASLAEGLFSDGSEPSAGDYVVLTVSDDGCGMADEVRARAFEPFYSTKQFGMRSGLGLSMVYGFAKQSGGHVDIESEVGRGTRISLYLPRSHEGTGLQTEVLQADELPRGHGETILVIEDDEDVRETAVRMLDALGYQVLDVPDAAAADRILKEDRKIDLILSDVVLPGGVSGLQFAAKARITHPGQKIIFMSGYPAESRAGQETLGLEEVILNKPIQLIRLAVALHDALE